MDNESQEPFTVRQLPDGTVTLDGMGTLGIARFNAPVDMELAQFIADALNQRRGRTSSFFAR
jgi:hypothetical protein